jgi:hypothetical protein
MVHSSDRQACSAGYSIETVNCCEYSFAASPGWDAVTGLGSPNFNILANLVLNNNTAFPNLGAYPAGNAATASSGDDDDEVKAVGISALVIGAVAFVIAAVAVGLAVTAKRALSSQ